MAKTILIVDDDPVIRMLIGEYLSSCGHEVQVLESGTACLEHLSLNVPDILVLDLQMPDMTGIEVLKKIRSDGQTAELPVIMLSANDDTEKVASHNEVRADQYIQKPFELKIVLEAIEKIVG